ncbi:MAG: hypothetical protein V1820_05770 [archaeon]
MKVVFFHSSGNAHIWKRPKKMQKRIQSAIENEEPQIALVREWGGAFCSPVELIEAVDGIPVPQNAILAVNGRVHEEYEREKRIIGCISVVKYTTPGGKQETVFFPKKKSYGTLAGAVREYFYDWTPENLRFGVIDGATGEWIWKKHDDTTERMHEIPGIKKFNPPGYSLDVPATLRVKLASGEATAWFPICSDVTPCPPENSCDLTIYASNDRPLAMLETKRGRLMVGADSGQFGIYLDGRKFSFLHHARIARTAERQYGSIKTTADVTSTVTFYQDPLAE